MSTRKRIAVPESELALHWSRIAGETMVTEEGELVRVLYPGLCVGGEGPDFKDAVLVFGDSRVVTGDVEIHALEEDWHRHGHGSNSLYCALALHVVGSAKRTTRTRLSDGRTVPVVVLGRVGWPRSVGGLPCVDVANGDKETALAALRAAGVERLRMRAGPLEQQLLIDDAQRVLGRRISRVLGYASNADIFEELGWRACMSVTRAALLVDGVEGRRARLLGMAGLLPGQRRLAGLTVQGEMPLWERIWSGLPSRPAGMDPLAWKLHGVYPNNFPVRRVVALADLLPRLAAVGESAEAVARECLLGVGPFPLSLERQLVVRGASYWRTHYDFGLPTRDSDVLGFAKARGLVVNAVVPWLYARSCVLGDATLRRAVLELYCCYPSPSSNAVTGHMRQQLGLGRTMISAAVEQGLLHLLTQYCREGLCFACPFGRQSSGVIASTESAGVAAGNHVRREPVVDSRCDIRTAAWEGDAIPGGSVSSWLSP
jgi:hypothetical protein